MVKNFMIENTYKQKLKNTINMRLFTFFLWKFLIMTTMCYLIYYIFSWEFIKGLNFKFFLGFNPSDISIGKYLFLKIYFISLILDWLKIIYFQKYEENLSKYDYFFKMFFLPSYNTLFFFLHFLLTTIFLALIEYAFHSKEIKHEKKDVFRYFFKKLYIDL